MSPHEFLDDLLNWYAFHQNATTGATVQEASIDFNEKHSPSNEYLGHLNIYIGEVIQQLETDKYISLAGYRIIENEMRENIYKVTFSGRMFALDGGYRGQHKEKTKEQQAIKRLQRNQLLLTFVLTIASIPPAAYYILELIRDMNLVLSFQFLVMAIVFVVGILLGLMLILLRREILYKDKS